MIVIHRAGIQTTVQDLGRGGLAHLGVARGGALDAGALTLANHLVGNSAGCAGLEIVVGPVEIEIARDGWFALCGAEFDATLAGQAVRPGWRTACRPGDRLKITGPRGGMRGYLAFDGGIDVPVMLGARGTDLGAGFGGHLGRALRAGDRLPLGPAAQLERAVGAHRRRADGTVRALPGPEYDDFDKPSQQAFWQRSWIVSTQSNRMGYRLQGAALTRRGTDELLSHGVLPGVVQVPPDGQPIVLLADAQTTGGYPKIAVVIEADLWQFAQLRPGAAVRFVACDAPEARRAQRILQEEQYRLEWSARGNRS